MAQSLSDKTSAFFLRLTGILRSSHALLGVLALLCLFFFRSASHLGLGFVTTGSFILFGLVVIIVIFRFALRGPEVDRQQPVVTISSWEARIVNIEPSVMERPEFRKLIEEIVKTRRDLPPPTGIIKGSSSNLSAIEELSPEKALELARQDRILLEKRRTLDDA